MPFPLPPVVVDVPADPPPPPPLVLTDEMRTAALVEVRAHLAPSLWPKVKASLAHRGYDPDVLAGL